MKKLFVLTFLLLILGTSIGFAENWVDINDNISIDLDSVKHVQVGYSDITKVKTKFINKDGYHIYQPLLIDTDTKLYNTPIIEFYDINGNLTHKITSNVNRKSDWIDGSNEQWIQEILKRTN